MDVALTSEEMTPNSVEAEKMAPLLRAQTSLGAPQQKFAKKNERQASCTETCKATVARQAKNKRG
jgi:hypothetical protein